MEITKEMRIKELEDMCKKLEAILTYEVIDIAPLNIYELPKAEVKLYAVGTGVDSHYFATATDRKKWLVDAKPKYSYNYTAEYLGNVAGKEDVIKETYENGDIRLLSIENSTEYDIYNFEKSKIKGKFVWDHYIDTNYEKIALLMTMNQMMDKDGKTLVK